MNTVDKDLLIGFCSKLPVSLEPSVLENEISAISSDAWGTTGGRVGVHSQVEAIFLRGYAPAEGDKPINDRPILENLPFTKILIKDLIPAVPQRCLLAKLKPASQVAPHSDIGDYFTRHIRIHFCVTTNPNVVMYCGKNAYRMKPGEIWALNNDQEHAVANTHATLPRIHMICDYEPSPALLGLLDLADRGLGTPVSGLADVITNL